MPRYVMLQWKYTCGYVFYYSDYVLVDSIILVLFMYNIVDLLCENRFLRAISHRRQSL